MSRVPAWAQVIHLPEKELLKTKTAAQLTVQAV